LHLAESLASLALLLRLSDRIWRVLGLLTKHDEQIGWLLCQMRQTQLKGAFMDECLQLGLERVDPLHRVQRLEAWVLHWLLNIWKSVEGEELRCLGELGPATIKIHFEILLLARLLLIGALTKVLIVVRVIDVDDEVNVQVEFELLCHEVSSQHVLRDQHLPGLEELISMPAIKRRAKRAEQSLCIVVQLLVHALLKLFVHEGCG